MFPSIELVDSVDDLTDNDIQTWNELAPTPFLRWEWLGSWWSTYGADQQLFVLRVVQDGKPVAFAPWYLERRAVGGQTIQFLGSGKVCSDHLSVIVSPENQESACAAIAKWIDESTRPESGLLPSHLTWDAIEWIGVDADDEAINRLSEELEHRGLAVERSEDLGCWAIDLPATWDDYVSQRSKSGRRETRAALKAVDGGSMQLIRMQTESDLEEYWDTFVALHQLRRQVAGTTGCFDHPPFGDFLRLAATELLRSQMLQLLFVIHDGRPIATQFALVDDNALYYYQSGMNPDAAELRPGLSILASTIEQSINAGRTRFDLLRGDEAYKQRWKASHVAAQRVRICSRRTSSALRNQVISAGATLKNLVKSTLTGGASPQ